MNRIVCVCVVTLFAQPSVAAEDQPRDQPAVVSKLQAKLTPRIVERLGESRRAALQKLSTGDSFPALFRTPARQRALTDPWGALTDLETAGRDLLRDLNQQQRMLPSIMRLASLFAEHSATTGSQGEVPDSIETVDDYASFCAAVLTRARDQRDAAIKEIEERERKFLHDWPDAQTRNFGPQLTFNSRTRTVLENDREFCSLVDQGIDWSQMLAAFRTLDVLTDRVLLEKLALLLQGDTGCPSELSGLDGDVLLERNTEQGWIIVGGPGGNRYDVQERVAVLLDVGGDDLYLGTLATGADLQHPHGVLIDLAGNDRYEPDVLGLATGRLGVGMLVDVSGDDHYQLSRGCGGVGLAGIGLLWDQQGRDRYEGNRFTQGAALGGLGVLIDQQGDDTHTSFGYALGFAGPLGVGCVVDVDGDDSYQCGRHYPSAYNQMDAPGKGPEHPKYQWDAFGIGVGLGRRVISPSASHQTYNLAGGIGMIIDRSGNDRYHSSNFSQGCGYYFGAGVKLDLAGNDEHVAARYGLASAAHVGLGLLVDNRGTDYYHSTGPTYNGGCAWDHSVCLLIDGGDGRDRYHWPLSTGPARADFGSWAVFADLGGDDSYTTKSLIRARESSLAVFYDAAGCDEYGFTSTKHIRPDNARTQVLDGALFIDGHSVAASGLDAPPDSRVCD